MKPVSATVIAALLLTACSQHAADQAQVGAATPPVIDAAIYSAALDNPARPEGDRERDAQRKPAEVLEFFGITPGMTVLDLFSGGGYYAEIIASVVGPEGKVVAHSNERYLDFVGDEFKARYADNRLPNVEVLMVENNELVLDTGSFDAVMVILSVHDFYNPAAPGWPTIDAEKLLGELYNGLKPGGVLCVIDHYAEEGAPRETGGTLHRIDRDFALHLISAAGFVLDGESDLLRNPDDDHSVIVFDPSVRGRTDRFILRFRKPE